MLAELEITGPLRTVMIVGHVIGILMALYLVLCLMLIQRELKRRERDRKGLQ